MDIEVNGIKLYYEMSGHGRPIVLLHGNGEDHRFFARLTPLLERDFTVYAVDSRNHGKSDVTEDLGYRLMTEDVAEFIRRTGLKRPVILGSSDGGIIALMLASAYPELVSAIVPCGANMTPDGLKGWFLSLIRLANRKRYDPKWQMILDEPDITAEELRRIKTPVLMLAGSRDLILDAHTREMASFITGCELHILSGETHTSYLKRHASKCAALLIPFLEKHPTQ